MSPISIRRRRRRHVAPLLFAALSVAGLASARIVVGAMPAPDQSPPDLGPLLVPRYFHNESEPLPAHELRERQVGGLCELGSHPCKSI